MSSATSGTERAAFIDQFLGQAFPLPFRFGDGDITDGAGHKSGQIDVVIEYPFMPSLPITGGGSSRLYLAENVAAAVEVKSTISSQWKQALHTAQQLAPLRRHFGSQMIMGAPPTDDIPLFVVGYTGWNRIETLEERLADAPNVDGILVIDEGLFVSSHRFRNMRAKGPLALWLLIACLHQATSSLKAASTDPTDYLR